MAVTIYIDNGNVTIRFPKDEAPDADTIHAIWEAIQAEKKPLASEQTDEGYPLN